MVANTPTDFEIFTSNTLHDRSSHFKIFGDEILRLVYKKGIS